MVHSEALSKGLPLTRPGSLGDTAGMNRMKGRIQEFKVKGRGRLIIQNSVCSTYIIVHARALKDTNSVKAA